MQTRIVSRLWFCRRSRRLKINIRRSSVHFRKSHLCADQLDVQEANFSVTQLHRSGDNFSWYRFTHWTVFPLLLCGIRWLKHFTVHRTRLCNPKGSYGEIRCRLTKPNMHNLIQCKHNNVIPTKIDHIPPNTRHSGPSATLYVFVDSEAVIKMIIKGRSPTMRHVSRTHRVALDWLFDRINLNTANQNQVCRHQKPTNSQTCWQRASSHVTDGIIFFICSILATSALSSQHQNFQLAKMHYGGEKNSATKRRRKGCVQVTTSSDECLFLSHVVKFFCRFKFDCIKKSGDADSFGETR